MYKFYLKNNCRMPFWYYTEEITGLKRHWVSKNHLTCTLVKNPVNVLLIRITDIDCMEIPDELIKKDG